MIGVYAHAVVKPEYTAKFEAVANKLAEISVAENGAISYEFGPQISDTSGEYAQYAFLERWESIEALEAHLETNHYIEADRACQEYLAMPMQISIYEI